MFCVFLQNTPSKEDELLVKFVHNDEVYTFSRDLSLKHSQILSNLIMKNDESPINIDYFHELDDFQLICDLFNYKRVFITKSNIDFLEFAGNFFQIPILIKKTAKFQSQYNYFLQNPIFKQIESLRHQVFSLFQRPSIFEDTEGDEDDNDADSENDTSIKGNGSEEASQIQNEEANKNEASKDGSTSKLPKIQYEAGYSSTVSHLLLSACLFDPLNTDKYLQIVAQDEVLLADFTESILKSNKFGGRYNHILKLRLFDHLQNEDKIKRMQNRNSTLFIMENYDTRLREYLVDLGNFYMTNQPLWKEYEYFADLIKNDDVDNFQTKFSLNPKIMNDRKIYECFFKLSMITSSVKCFKYLLVNYYPLFGKLNVDKKMVQPSIIGGNIEIFHLILEKYEGNPVDFIRDSILFQKKDIFDWIVENNCQFLSLYNTCCSTVLYGHDYVAQKFFTCSNCYTGDELGCCKFCAKNCHVNHNIRFKRNSPGCFCDDDCKISKNIDVIGSKKFVEIDDLILLSIYCLNTYALKTLINEGAYIIRCRDRTTKEAYVLNDQKLVELISGLKRYKDQLVDERPNTFDHYILSLKS